MTTAPRHVIFGTGAIGLTTSDALRRRGETTRSVNRSGSARAPGNVAPAIRHVLDGKVRGTRVVSVSRGRMQTPAPGSTP